MKKVTVKVCQGTTCYVMGGNASKSILDALTEKYGDKIEIISVRCLEICHKQDYFSKAPYVYVNDEIISSANVEKVINAIESKLKNE